MLKQAQRRFRRLELWLRHLALEPFQRAVDGIDDLGQLRRGQCIVADISRDHIRRHPQQFLLRQLRRHQFCHLSPHFV